MGRLKKHASKRTTLRTKYKIQKKVKEYKKKQKRLAKKNPHKLYSHHTSSLQAHVLYLSVHSSLRLTSFPCSRPVSLYCRVPS